MNEHHPSFDVFGEVSATLPAALTDTVNESADADIRVTAERNNAAALLYAFVFMS